MQAFRSVTLGGASAALAMILTTSPVLAVECTEASTTLPPGVWAGAATLEDAVYTSDAYAPLYSDAEVSFTLTVDAKGVATGALAASGRSAGNEESLGVAAEGFWTFEAPLSNAETPMIRGTGVFDLALETYVELGKNESAIAETTHQFTRAIDVVPLATDCSTAYGDFDGAFSGGETEALTWIATRTGGSKDREVDELYADITEIVEAAVSGTVEVGLTPALVRDLARDMARLNTILSSPEYCAPLPAGLRPGSPGLAYAHRTMRFLLLYLINDAADEGYDTIDVIDMMTYGLEAAGLDPSQCGADVDTINAERAGMIEEFRLFLVERLATAREHGRVAEIGRIQTAAFQLGLDLGDDAIVSSSAEESSS